MICGEGFEAIWPLQTEGKQDQPHEHTPPNYGAKQQVAKQEDKPPLNREQQQYVRHNSSHH